MNHNYEKILYVLFMIFLFSIIYTFFPNDDFAGWIEISNNPLSYINKYRIKFNVFSKYSKEYKNFITLSEFMNIPIIKVNNYLHVINDKSEETETDENKKIKTVLFNIYAADNKMSLDEFTSLPFKYDLYHITDPKLLRSINMSTKYSVSDYFDRLYYSAITQTTVGYGDIFPASRMLRIFSMLQALSTIFIIII
jgi:hypothetical protein